MEINLSPRDLRAFLAVAKTQSFSQAAKQIHLSQSALSSLIARIEESLGAKLFERTTRAVALTDAGQVLAIHAEQVLLDLASMGEAVRDVATLHKGSVTVAALPSVAARVIPALFHVYQQRYPGIKLSLVDTLSKPAFELVRERKVDFAITAANQMYSDLLYVPLVADTFDLLAAPGHPLEKHQGPIRLIESFAWPHISMTRPSSVRQYVDAAALQHGIQFSPAYEVDHLVTIGGMVSTGLGVAALPSLAADVIMTTGLVRRPLIDPVIRRPIGLVKRADGVLSGAAQAMVSLLQQQIGNFAPLSEGLQHPAAARRTRSKDC